MTVFLYVLFVFLGMASMGILLISNGAIQQCLAGIVLLASVACLIGAGICSRLDGIRQVLLGPVSKPAPAAPIKPRPRIVAALLVLCCLVPVAGFVAFFMLKAR